MTRCSQRQSTVSLSTAEAEYVAASSACKEVVWLQELLFDIGEFGVKPTTTFIDDLLLSLLKNMRFTHVLNILI